MRKILSVLTLMALIFTVSTSTVFASGTTEVYDGVSPNNTESQISIQSTSKPSKVWNTSTKGEYPFSGSSNYQTLYTNYKFTRNENYTITVKNSSDYSMKVKVVKGLLAHTSKTIKANSTQSFSAEGLKSSDNVYISFEGDYMDFSGSISGWEW